MSDIRIFSVYDDGFEITLGESENYIGGNIQLLNRFQITFFDEGMFFESSDGSGIIDDFGGKAFSMIGTPKAISDIQSITASLTAAIKNTVESIQQDETEVFLETEKLKGAVLESVDVVKGVITAIINVYPVEIESSEYLSFNIPIISK